jgi:hypothetical protein
MSARNLPGVKSGQCVRLTTSLPSELTVYKMWGPRNPTTLRTPRPVTGIALSFFLPFLCEGELLNFIKLKNKQNGTEIFQNTAKQQPINTF